ncbi:hypothetical protein Taro_029495, partial [Colocasia esculenta]|nr:hypothetical protein [Colocasia esculenta]
ARQSYKRIRVVRLETTTDNQRIVGLLIPSAAVETVLQERNTECLLLFSITREKQHGTRLSTTVI